jgi:hypothetical protein
MMLDHGLEGRILMNVYSDDGLESTTNETMWDKFMSDFKSNFGVQEKSLDYFLGADIIQHDSDVKYPFALFVLIVYINYCLFVFWYICYCLFVFWYNYLLIILFQ